MILFGHIGITAFIGALLFLPIVFLGVGAILPDLLDKPLNILGIAPCSRYFGHSIFFPIIAGLITLVIFRKKLPAIAITFGGFAHIIQDFQGNLPLFFPLIDYEFIHSCGPINVASKLNVIEISAEIVGLILLFILIKYWDKVELLRNKLWSRLR